MSNAVGIDLGTTNSSIAMLSGATVRVFKDEFMGMEYTPSAVYMNRDNNLIVGFEARDRAFVEPANAVTEFKRNMGAVSPFTFARNGLVMQPEELSAEVLKAVTAHVTRSGGSPVKSAVITIPADFDTHQCDATMRAAKLSGITECLLLPEPVAAAQAYSFDSADDNTFWLVYDIGGGTFDAAIIRVSDGQINVVEHRGDNRLGGSDIDKAIVNELLIPALPAPFTEAEKKELENRDPKWNIAWAKLKMGAEKAKIALSSQTSTSAAIEIDNLCKHKASGEIVEFYYSVQRADLERLAMPIIRKTINKIKELLTAARLKPGDIGKLILVGGPTMMPLLRTMLRELSIDLEYSVDPLTVVARGAAIFAASQFVGQGAEPEVRAGEYGVKLTYPAVSPDIDPEIAGRVIAHGQATTDFTGYSVEFVNQTMQPAWRSGKIRLAANGAFITNLEAQKDHANRFAIELCDPRGGIVPVEPAAFDIVVKGSTIGDTVHNHNIGVQLANDEMCVFYEKGNPLPSRRLQTLRTTVTVQKGSSDSAIRVPVCEGERDRASRNRHIGELEIFGTEFPRDVPAGSEIHITVDVDKSHNVGLTAYIPHIDQQVNVSLVLATDSPDPVRLKKDTAAAMARFTALRGDARRTQEPTAERVLQQIEEERMIHEIDQLAAASENDPGSGRDCMNRLSSLNEALDNMEDALSWPKLTAEAEEKISRTRRMVTSDEFATEADRRTFAVIEREVNDAIRRQQKGQLERGALALDVLRQDIARRDPAAWAGAFNTAKSKRSQMTDKAQADRLISQGESAIRNKDAGGIQSAVRGLWELIPDDEPSGSGKSGSTVTR